MNKTKSEKFAIIQEGKIACVVDGYPEQELAETQIPLTIQEYNFLKGCGLDLSLAKNLIRAIENKIRAVYNVPNV